MKFSISINDAWTGQSVADAKIFLRVREVEQSAHSDREGKFFREDDREYVGEDLLCRVKRQGYELWETSTQVERNEIHLDVELMPKKIELAVSIIDNTGKPLQGVQVTIEVAGHQVGSVTSNDNGIAKFMAGGNLVRKRLNYSAIRKGFVSALGEFEAQAGRLPTLTLQKEQLAHPKNWKYWLGMLAVVVPYLIVSPHVFPSRFNVPFINPWVVLLGTLAMAAMLPVKPTLGLIAVAVLQSISTASLFYLSDTEKPFWLAIFTINALLVMFICWWRNRRSTKA